MNSEDNNGLNKARAYAESVYEQNLAAFADELRGLLAEDRELLETLNRITNMDNTDAARRISQMPATERKFLLQWLIPAARLGMSVGMFAMEDKYSERPESEGS